MAKPDETSIWKKEITFRRKPKTQAPDPVSVQPDRPHSAPPAANATSIWKKEITFRRKPEPRAAPPAAPSPPPRLGVPYAPVAMPPLDAPAGEPGPPTTAPPVVPVATPEIDEAPTEPAAGSAPPVSAPVSLPSPVAVPADPGHETGPSLTAPEPSRSASAETTASQSRRERREAKRAADELAKKQRKLAKKERNSSRHKRVVGLKIGASQIAAAQVVNKGIPRVVRMARAPLPPGVVVGGELRDPEELAAALKALFRKNKLPKSGVRLGIANNRIGVRTFEISGVEDEKQLANAVRFRAQEVLPIPLDEAVLDYRVLEDRVGEDGVRSCRVLLVVAHRELVERYVAACRKAKLKLVGIDLEAFGLLRALAGPGRLPSDDAAVVCVAIGRDRSTLAVSNGRVCEFTRVLAWGGADLDVALARTLDLSPAAAEPLKRQLALGLWGEAAGLDAEQADAAREAMVAELRNFARELVGSLRYYQEQPNSLGIAEILITGGTSAADGLAAELERLVGIPVRVADPLARVRLPRKLRNHGSVGSLAVAVGLGIED